MFLHPGSTFFGRREKEERRAKEEGEDCGGEKEENGTQIWLLRGVLALCVFHRTKKEEDEKKGACQGEGSLSRSVDGVKKMTESEAEILFKATISVLKFVIFPFNSLSRHKIDKIIE